MVAAQRFFSLAYALFSYSTKVGLASIVSLVIGANKSFSSFFTDDNWMLFVRHDLVAEQLWLSVSHRPRSGFVRKQVHLRHW